MEIRLNYIAKDGCVNDITIKSARGAKGPVPSCLPLTRERR